MYRSGLELCKIVGKISGMAAALRNVDPEWERWWQELQRITDGFLQKNHIPRNIFLPLLGRKTNSFPGPDIFVEMSKKYE
jgi:hypothetical protein